MQTEFQDRNTIIRKIFLKCVYLFITTLYNFLGCKVMNTRNKYILIVRTVEYSDHSFLWNLTVNTPQEIMPQLFRCWSLKTVDPHALGIERTENMTDGSIFAACIYRLKNDQQRMFVLGI